MRRRRWPLVLVMLATAAVVIGGVVVRSGLAQVASVRVVGAETVPAGVIRAAAKITSRDNALTVDLEAARARVAALPSIAAVEVRRDGALGIVIEVRERVPALVLVSGGSRRILDRDGVELAAGGGPELPVLEAEGEAVPAGIVRAALRLSDRLRPAEGSRARIRWSPSGGLVLAGARTTVLFGDGEGLNAKLDLWRRLRLMHDRPLRRVDLSQLPRVSVKG